MHSWRFGDHLPADALTAAATGTAMPTGLRETDRQCALHFARRARRGDVIVAGRGFGAGRAAQPMARLLRERGVAAVIAGGVTEGFRRAAIEAGILVVELPDAVAAYEQAAAKPYDAFTVRFILELGLGMRTREPEVHVDMDHGQLRIGTDAFAFKPCIANR